MEKHDEYIELLKTVPNFQNVQEDVLAKFVDVIDEVSLFIFELENSLRKDPWLNFTFIHFFSSVAMLKMSIW